MTLKTLRRADVVLGLALAAVAAAIVMCQSLGRGQQPEGAGRRGLAVAVSVDNRPFLTVPFSEVRGVMTVGVPVGEDRSLTVEIAEDGRARVVEADCPDKVCIKTGWIDRPGELIVCLPNRVVVTIQGGPGDSDRTPPLEPGLDGIAY